MTARTITLPVNPGSNAWSSLAWPVKEVSDNLPYSIDATAWLADGGLTLASATVTSPGVTVGGVSVSGGLVTVSISGGVAGTTAAVTVTLQLGGGSQKVFGVALPVILAALFWHAKAGETVSVMAARSAQAGRRSGCLMCWFLNWAVQRNHCALSLSPEPIAPPLAAGPWLVLYALVVCCAGAVLPVALVWWLLG